MAIPVPGHIVRDLQTAPTKEYYDAYHSLNARLDEIVSCGAEFLIKNGFNAYANTTKTVKQNEEWRTPLPHKTVATRAGLGWIGKRRDLLVTKEYGSAIRLSSLVTDAPLPFGFSSHQESMRHLRHLCEKLSCNGSDRAFMEPRNKTGRALPPRNLLQHTTSAYEESTGIEADLCGLCFAVCPYTQNG